MEPSVSVQPSLINSQRLDPGDILEDARTFYSNAKLSGSLPTYHDYEHYKHILHDNGWFGYEFKLARILHL